MHTLIIVLLIMAAIVYIPIIIIGAYRCIYKLHEYVKKIRNNRYMYRAKKKRTLHELNNRAYYDACISNREEKVTYAKGRKNREATFREWLKTVQED